MLLRAYPNMPRHLKEYYIKIIKEMAFSQRGFLESTFGLGQEQELFYYLRNFLPIYELLPSDYKYDFEMFKKNKCLIKSKILNRLNRMKRILFFYYLNDYKEKNFAYSYDFHNDCLDLLWCVDLKPYMRNFIFEQARILRNEMRGNKEAFHILRHAAIYCFAFEDYEKWSATEIEPYSKSDWDKERDNRLYFYSSIRTKCNLLANTVIADYPMTLYNIQQQSHMRYNGQIYEKTIKSEVYEQSKG
jgi:hypothetical protein